jgi:hypothetical protein
MDADLPGKPVPYIERTRNLYAQSKPYQWVHHDPIRELPAWTPITKPLSALRIAVISSSGIHRSDQDPFHFRNDISHREIPLDTDPTDLRIAHFGYDMTDARRDPGCVFPLRALRDLARDGVIGGLVDPLISFMGGIYSARLVRNQVATRLRDFVLRERADLAFLIPI